MENQKIKEVEILDKDYAIRLIIHLNDEGYKHGNGIDHIQVIKDLIRSLGHNMGNSLVRYYISADTENKTYGVFTKLDKPDEFFNIKDKIITVEKHGKKLKVKSHLNRRHQEHCLCWSNCKFFKPTGANNCEIAQKLLQFDKDNGVTTPVWECIKYE